jgi:hypothetical protein
MHITLENIIDSGDASIHDVHSKASGASGTLPFTAELSRTRKQEFVFQC